MFPKSKVFYVLRNAVTAFQGSSAIESLKKPPINDRKFEGQTICFLEGVRTYKESFFVDLPARSRFGKAGDHIAPLRGLQNKPPHDSNIDIGDAIVNFERRSFSRLPWLRLRR